MLKLQKYAFKELKQPLQDTLFWNKFIYLLYLEATTALMNSPWMAVNSVGEGSYCRHVTHM